MNPIYPEVTGVLLAGGRSRRFGRNKALAEFQDQRLIERVLDALRVVFPKILVATNTPEEYEFLAAELLRDEAPYLGPLGGILSALQKIATPYAFVAACDMPLLSPEAIRGVVAAGLGHAAAVPFHPGGREYLMALYARSLIPQIRASLERGVFAMREFCAGVGDLRWVPIAGESAANVNTPEDLRRLEGRHAL
ncbi:MAG: molybdenum cofactor guanylyltransferase [Deltaproteobacteria bacterium]|nr:molybdenum cofactor guanylyltransferase [Deltaproteobacteria bacterium]